MKELSGWLESLLASWFVDFAEKYDSNLKIIEKKLNELKFSNKKNFEKLSAKHEEVLRQRAELESIFNGEVETSRIGLIIKFCKYYNLGKDVLEKAKESWYEWFMSLASALLIVFIVKTFWFGFYAVPTGSAEPNFLVGDRICGIKYPYFFSNPKKGDLVIFEDPHFKYSSNPIVALYQKYIGFPVPGILPAGPDSWVKRLIALPGEKVDLRINQNKKAEVYINDEKINEPYVNPYPLIVLNRKAGFIDLSNPLFKIPFVGQIAFMFGLHKRIVTGAAENTSGFGMSYTYDPTRPYNDQPFYSFSKDEIKRNEFGRPYILDPKIGNPRLDNQNLGTVPEGRVFCVGDNRHGSFDGREWGFLDSKLIFGRASFILFSIDGTETWWFMDMIKNPITFFTKKIRWARTFRMAHPFKEIPKN